MSRSVTVIEGITWKQRSVTWNRNSVGKLESNGEPPQFDARGSEGDRPQRARKDDGDGDWDTCYRGRTFERRIKTL